MNCMGKKRKKESFRPPLKDQLWDAVGIPENIYKDTARIELISDTTVMAEGVGSILSFDENSLSLRVDGRLLMIEGEDLCLKNMENRTLTVTGKIHGMRFI